MPLRPVEDLPDTLSIAVPLSEPLLRASDVALLLDIPRSTVYDYAKRKADPLPSVQIGRHRRFHRSEVERWLARQRA
jgi:excisionase family DNA binding protein